MVIPQHPLTEEELKTRREAKPDPAPRPTSGWPPTQAPTKEGGDEEKPQEDK